MSPPRLTSGAVAWASLQPEWLRLEAYLTAANAWVSAAPFVNPVTQITEPSRREGVLAILRNAAYVNGRLSPTGELGAGVFNGTVTAERWAKVANENGRTIELAWRESWSVGIFERAWSEIVVQTATDVRDTAVDVAKATTPTLVVVAVILALYLAIQRGR